MFVYFTEQDPKTSLIFSHFAKSLSPETEKIEHEHFLPSTWTAAKFALFQCICGIPVDQPLARSHIYYRSTRPIDCHSLGPTYISNKYHLVNHTNTTNESKIKAATLNKSHVTEFSAQLKYNSWEIETVEKSFWRKVEKVDTFRKGGLQLKTLQPCSALRMGRLWKTATDQRMDVGFVKNVELV